MASGGAVAAPAPTVARKEHQTGGPARRFGPLARLLDLGHGRFVTLYFAASFTILFALTASALLFGSSAVRDQVGHGLSSSASAAASYLDLTLKARGDVLSAFAGRPSLATSLADGLATPATRAVADDFLAQLLKSVDGAYNTWLTTPDGKVLDIYPAQPALVGADFSYRDWFHGAMTTAGPYLSSAYTSASTGHPLVVAEATRVTDRSGRLLGVVGVAFDLRRLQVFVDSFGTVGGVRLLVADQAGTVVARPGGDIAQLVKASDPDLTLALAGNVGRDDHASDTMAAYAPVPWAHWALVASVPTSEALAGLGVMQRAVLLTAFLLALVNLGKVLLLYAALRRRAAAEIAVVAANQGLEERVQQRTAALERANQELESFSYSVSHDLRAPLRSIDSFSNILLSEHADQLDDEARRILGVVVRNSRQMGVLIDDLLAFSRVSRKDLELRPVDMRRLAQADADELVAAEPDRRIEFDVGNLCPVPGDTALLNQVWKNLLGNAAKFTRSADVAHIEVRCERVDGSCRYTVRDNGVGFDPAYVSKLFAPFSRLHSTTEFEGTGIGLAIVARIVERHGGHVWADGALGQGAAFGFTLPAERITS